MRNLARLLAAVLLIVTGALAVAQAPAPQGRPDYELGPGDNIRILVFQNPDLTLETRIGEQGTITYPLIGMIRVGGMPVAAAEKAIADALREGGFIKQPHVNIVVLSMHGNSVSVLGHVRKPGLYPIETVNVRVLEMLAVAGGIAPDGADVAVLTGMRDGKPFRREVDVEGIFLTDGVQGDAFVAPGDVIYVHRAPMFYIYGEVQNPGAYRVERGMTVRQALARGGGPTARGTERSPRLYRRGAGSATETRSDLSDPVRPGDVFFVRESLF
ncbi:MAG: polysaccharide export protein EpsE [Burkholderiales bacterium]|nr:polysaccharide export protein EpsE [Burkholderiales bacterium]